LNIFDQKKMQTQFFKKTACAEQAETPMVKYTVVSKKKDKTE